MERKIRSKVRCRIRRKQKRSRKNTGIKCCVAAVLWIWIAQVCCGMEQGGFDLEVGTGEFQGTFPYEDFYETGENKEEWGSQEQSQENTGFGGWFDGESGSEQNLSEVPEYEPGYGEIYYEEPYHGQYYYEQPCYEEPYREPEVPYERGRQWKEEYEEAETTTVSASEHVSVPEPTLTPTSVPAPALVPAPTSAPTPTPTDMPAPSPSPEPKPSVTPQLERKESVKDSRVRFAHREKPAEGENPEIEILCEGKVQILSVRRNGKECPRRRAGRKLVLEGETASDAEMIEVLAVTEDGTVTEMEPWIWRRDSNNL